MPRKPLSIEIKIERLVAKRYIGELLKRTHSGGAKFFDVTIPKVGRVWTHKNKKKLTRARQKRINTKQRKRTKSKKEINIHKLLGW